MSENQTYNEKELLLRIAEGEEQAFEQLYLNYRKKAYGIALTYMSAPTLAEDVLQDCFLKLWSKREALPNINHFDQYFFVTLRNMLISALRNRERQEKIREYLHKSQILNISPNESTQVNDLQQRVRQALHELPEKQQQIYRMSREEGLSHEEIGHIMKLSPRTVSNIISLVLNHLRNNLQQAGYLTQTICLPILFFS